MSKDLEDNCLLIDCILRSVHNVSNIEHGEHNFETFSDAPLEIPTSG